MNTTRTVQVNPEFISQALYDRFDDVKDRRGKKIHDECIDSLIQMISEGGTLASSASEIIDNRLINGESGDYEDLRRHYLRESDEYTGSEEQIEKIHDYCEDYGYFYDDDLEEFCSY